jgi:hypothetical protein
LSDSLPDNTDESEIANAEQLSNSEHKVLPSESLVESGKQNIQFEFKAYDSDIVICGAKNSGKSYLANVILKSLNNITVFVWDFNHQFHDARSMLFSDAIFQRGNIVAIFDELHLYTSKQAILKPFNNLILSGRPRGISCISISTRSASLPNNVLSNSQHVFAFRLNLQSDVEFLETWMGEGVWQLLPKDKRKKLQNEPELPEHTFYYRNQDATTGVIGKV